MEGVFLPDSDQTCASLTAKWLAFEPFFNKNDTPSEENILCEWRCVREYFEVVADGHFINSFSTFGGKRISVIMAIDSFN